MKIRLLLVTVEEGLGGWESLFMIDFDIVVNTLVRTSTRTLVYLQDSRKELRVFGGILVVCEGGDGAWWMVDGFYNGFAKRCRKMVLVL